MSILQRFRLDGQVAVITGAGRGIGAAIALAYAEAGAKVVLGARTLEQLEETAAAVTALGSEALVVLTDVMEEAQLDNLAQQAVQRFGRIDIVVNNAGGYPPKPALQTSTRDFNNAMQFNVGTAFALTRICVPLMMENGGGSILNISSVAGEFPSPWFAGYGTAKAALSVLTRELAQEFAPHIRVNAIAVGSTKTSALNTVLTPEIEQTMVALTPMARLGEVEDIAAGALYLCSPAGAYITGEILGIHGGLTRLNMEMPRAF
jgi:7-alpha-hydroxysteroid dehydrogenase